MEEDSFADSQYSKDFKVSDVALKNGTYLRPVTYKELVGELIGINAIHFAVEKKDHRKALAYVNDALKLRQSSPELHRLKGTILFDLHKKSTMNKDPKTALVHRSEAFKEFEKAKQLGFIILPREDYLKKLEEKKAMLKTNENQKGTI